MSDLKKKILKGDGDLLFYSFAPPKTETEEDRLQVISKKQLDRVNELDIDALILYDIQDESHRTSEERTYKYKPTIRPEDYAKVYLKDLKTPKVIYKSIADHTREMFGDWLHANKDLEHMVLVGASSKAQVEQTRFSLLDAYDVTQKFNSDILLGGVAIPERHAKSRKEHERIVEKTRCGCNFFVSQCVYNINDTKNMLSDYYYHSLDNGGPMRPMIFTISPCGSEMTLDFMKWLGIEVPIWLYNDLKHAKNILDTSVNMSVNIATEILEFARTKQIPVGFNIESISIKKDEIDAATEILLKISELMR